MHIYTFASPVKCVFEPSKELKSKTINARKKQGQFWNLHQIPHKTSNPDFRLIFFDEGRFSNKNYNYFFLVQKKT